MGKYLESPLESTKLPRGIPYIIGNEAAERFSFYGMKGILTVFMTKHLLDSSGAAAYMSDEDAKTIYHLFTAAAYFFPMLGSLISDIFWGKYKTIIILSLGYCVGHGCLALMDLGPATGAYDMKPWLFAGLIFIAMGAGGVKPCVSAHVGDQFGKKNQHLVSTMFSWFYFSINVGAMASTLLTPVLLKEYGPWAAFGLPGILMAIATFVFWLGRHKFVHIPAAGWRRFKEETLSRNGLRSVLNLAPIFLIFIPVFWALFDQTGSAWVLQADKMDRQFLGIHWLPSQVQAVNPFLILVLIPVFAYGVYPMIDKVFRMTPLRKISMGLFATAIAFALPSLIEENISGGDVIKTTSVAALESLRPVGILDGEVEGPGWSSNEAPTEEVAQELIIRLRERSAWMIDTIEIDPNTTFDEAELRMTLSNLQRELTQRAHDAEDSGQATATGQGEQLSATIKKIKGMAKNETAISELLRVARDDLSAIGLDGVHLDPIRYRPQEIQLFAADFSDRAVPDLHSKLAEERAGLESSLEEDRKAVQEGKEGTLTPEERATIHDSLAELDEVLGADEDSFHAAQQWTPLGNLQFETRGDAQRLTFGPMTATHVLVRIKSNHGGPRVKLGEVRVHTTDALPAAPLRGAEEVWPNVAALGFKPGIGWQFLAYILLTAAEVMVSITALEFAYTQAPKRMKSFIMGIFFMGVSLGNLFTAGVNFFIQNDDGTVKLEGASYYWFFTMLVAVTAVVFVFYAMRYKGRTFVQGEEPGDDPEAMLVDQEPAGPHGEQGQDVWEWENRDK